MSRRLGVPLTDVPIALPCGEYSSMHPRVCIVYYVLCMDARFCMRVRVCMCAAIRPLNVW